jgi:hypothetical protein
MALCSVAGMRRGIRRARTGAMARGLLRHLERQVFKKMLKSTQNAKKGECLKKTSRDKKKK